MQATWPPNRPISAQPEGQRPFRAVCGVATLAHSRAMGCAPCIPSRKGLCVSHLRSSTGSKNLLTISNGPRNDAL
ncbi:MAG: hypothetical protein LBV61_04820, partial [Burkholderiaceae bacterium]|nr:hypothetical protein [Burkholderiaceae bacterium]